MDPLSAAASVIAVIQVTQSVIKLCKGYITSVQDAPKDLRAILIEVGAVKCVLETLDLLGSSKSCESEVEFLRKLRRPDGPLDECYKALQALEALLLSESKSPKRRRKKMVALPFERLSWPFKREKAQKLLEEIGRHKATLSFALVTESIKDIKHIRTTVEQIRETTDSVKFHESLRWLITTDTSPNHNQACELHEPQTGQWLSRSPEYTNWKDSTTQFLWIHGIPGAGKTVLFSYIAQDIAKLCNDAKDFGYAYYYCWHTREQDETSHILLWTISQLCRQIHAIPPEVKSLVDEGVVPRVSRLLEVLKALTGYFSRVYLLVDALDESSERHKLLKLMSQISTDPEFRRVQLLGMSRKELDIERALLPTATDISLSNPYVDEDIHIYIQASLQRDSKFVRWPLDLIAEIEDQLVKGAKGMFRWVFCQLDRLRRLNSKSRIRAALKELPETLDETYERILCDIPSDLRIMAHKTLQLLASGWITELSVLTEALAVDVHTSTYNFEDSPLDILVPLEACTCLVTYSPRTLKRGRYVDKVSLAHYTVKEFLVSPRIPNGPARFFQTTKDAMNLLIAFCLLIFLLEGPRPEQTFNGHMDLAIESWDLVVHRIESASVRATLSTLVVKLLDPARFRFRDFIKLSDSTHTLRTPNWTTAGPKPAITLAYICWYGYIEAARFLLSRDSETEIFDARIEFCFNYHSGRWNAEDSDSPTMKDQLAPKVTNHFQFPLEETTTTVVHIAAMLHRTHILELLISKGANVNALSADDFSVLMSTLCSKLSVPPWTKFRDRFRDDTILDCVDILLSNNADPKLPGTWITPLQLAIRFWKQYPAHCVDIVERLLAAGADSNGVGDDEANMTRIRRRCKYRCAQDHDLKLQERTLTETALHHRGEYLCYDTPLQILETLEAERHGGDRQLLRYDTMFYSAANERISVEEVFRRVKTVLQKYGAQSLHLFPVSELPGYNEADMEKWRKMKTPAAKEHVSAKSVDLRPPTVL